MRKMRDRLDTIVATIHPLDMLEKHKSMNSFGSALVSYRSETLMRGFTFSQEPVDCLLFAIKHLRNGESESELSEALAWLNKVHEAYINRPNPDFWHEFADTIRLDLIIQLNGLRLSHIWKSESEVAAQLLDEKLDYNAKENLTKTHKLLLGLLGFHLGIGLEMTQQAVDAYKNLLPRANDVAAKQLIEQRIKGLNEHEYLNPSDFNMDRQKFDGLRMTERNCKDLSINVVWKAPCQRVLNLKRHSQKVSITQRG
jgi:hypothetical protein